MQSQTKKIVLLGPESSGKTTLAAALSGRFGFHLVSETARDYLEEKSGRYDYSDLSLIHDRQLKAEEGAENEMKGRGVIILDTCLLMIQAWSEIVFGRCDNRILTSVSRTSYDLFLLCKPDIPWASDPLREHPAEKDRRRIFLHYLEMLKNQPVPFRVIAGDSGERMRIAEAAVRSIL